MPARLRDGNRASRRPRAQLSHSLANGSAESKDPYESCGRKQVWDFVIVTTKTDDGSAHCRRLLQQRFDQVEADLLRILAGDRHVQVTTLDQKA